MSQTYFDVPLDFYYDIKGGIPLLEAIEQLTAIQRIISRQQAIISSVSNSLIEHSEVFVSELKEGSWTEDLVVRLFFKNKEDFEKFKAASGDIPLKDWVKIVMAMGVGAFLFHGAETMIAPKKEGSPVNITISNNSGIVSLGKSIDLTDDQINTIINKNSKQNKEDKRAVLSFLSPAKNGQASKISVGGHDELSINSDVFNKIPDAVPSQDGEERNKFYQNLDIYIYASDRDKSKSGWAGIAPELFTKRVKFELGEGVTPDSLHGRTKVKADIVVHERYVASKRAFEPFKIEVIAIA